MAKCKCCSRQRIVSSVVQSIKDGNTCRDYCANPICAEPNVLSLYAPLIYDEIGINLCTQFSFEDQYDERYANAVRATIKVLRANYIYSTEGITIEAITGRPNCYVVTLSNIEIVFAMQLYDASCKLLGTIYPTVMYLPSSTTNATYDVDTNPSSVELEIFAPYGFSYDTNVQPVINFVGFGVENNSVKQGVNMFAMAKMLDFSIDGRMATVGLTLVLQSLYYAGYKVQNAGRIEIPKGSILTPENSDCMRFVAGDLLDLEIKPLDLDCSKEEKRPCVSTKECGGCNSGAIDDTSVISIVSTTSDTETEG